MLCFFSSSLPPATKLGQGNLFSSVCQEFCSQGGSAALYAGIPLGTRNRSPWDQRQTHPGSRHPLVQCMLGDMGNERVVRNLLECKLVSR